MHYTVRPIHDRTSFAGRHKLSPFASSWSQTLTLLDHELRQLAAREIVLEMDVRENDIRIDGQVRANARPSSPAVRLAFESKHGPLVYATDVFYGWQDNVRAIALGLEALRKVDRYGVVRRGEQYAGFKQLGAGRAMPSSHMTSDEAWVVLAEVTGFSLTTTEADDPDEVRAYLREARRVTHPDRNGGDRTQWDRVEEAAKVLGVLS